MHLSRSSAVHARRMPFLARLWASCTISIDVVMFPAPARAFQLMQLSADMPSVADLIDQPWPVIEAILTIRQGPHEAILTTTLSDYKGALRCWRELVIVPARPYRHTVPVG